MISNQNTGPGKLQFQAFENVKVSENSLYFHVIQFRAKDEEQGGGSMTPDDCDF